MTRDVETQVVTLRRNSDRTTVRLVLAGNVVLAGVTGAVHEVLRSAGVGMGLRAALTIGAGVVVVVAFVTWAHRCRVRPPIVASVRLGPDRIAFEPRRGRAHEAARGDVVVRRIAYVYLESEMNDHQAILEFRFPKRWRSIRIACVGARTWPQTRDGDTHRVPPYSVDTEGWAALLAFAEQRQ